MKIYQLYIYDMINQSPCIQFNTGFDDVLRHSGSLFLETITIINTQLTHNVSEAGSAPSHYCLSMEAKPVSKMLRFNGILMTGKSHKGRAFTKSPGMCIF
jgi:hypothetical protein